MMKKSETGLEITSREIVNPGDVVINTAMAESLAMTAPNSEREATSSDTVTPSNDQNYDQIKRNGVGDY